MPAFRLSAVTAGAIRGLSLASGPGRPRRPTVQRMLLRARGPGHQKVSEPLVRARPALVLCRVL